jgi:glycosyltransferase involved in cell wall biosynthesis
MAREGSDPIDREVVEEFLRRHHDAYVGTELLIIVPAYNEAGTIADLAHVLPSSVLGLQTNTVISVDGATDDTAQLAEAQRLRCAVAPVNRGQGAALRVGYEIGVLVGAKYIAIVDADGQWDPQSIEELVRPLVDDVADFTQGSRVLGSTHVGDPVRDLGVTVFARLVSLLTGHRVTDTSSGIRAFRTSLLEHIRLDEPQYQSSELLISALFAGARLLEFPVVLSKRQRGKSKKGNNLKYGANYSRVVLRTWIRERLLFNR